LKHSIQILFIVFISTILFWFFFDVFPKNNFRNISLEKNDSVNKEKVDDTININKTPKSLSIGEINWDKDIFYDRSEVYKNWFKLTGISKMREGYKAFVNNEIIREGDRIRGFTVRLITEKKVVLKKNNSSVTLRL
tara:strand:- start:479 stop:886 length:408 start_codon:yes stop_codon:yes gene_type:complete